MFSHALLLAQAESTQFKFLYLAVFALLGFVLPYVIGHFAAKRVRMPDYGWKIGMILMTLSLALIVLGRSWDSEAKRFRIPLGIDLKGGVILIYEVADSELSALTSAATDPGDAAADAVPFEMNRLITALSRRINPSGTKEIVIRPYGSRQVEIIIPEVDTREVETIKKRISTSGVLQFRIVANNRDHEEVLVAAREMADNPATKRSAIVRDDQGKPIGYWARVAREDAEANPQQPFKFSPTQHTLRDASTGSLLTLPSSVFRGEEDAEIAALQQYLNEQGIKEIDILMATNDGYDVNGAHLGAVSQGRDELLNPTVNFNLKGEGVERFANLTRDFAPDGNFNRQLGIMLDNYLLSAPNIQEMIVGRGRITGKFTTTEVEFLVNILSAGSLPVILNPDPISESIIDPLLGQATIEQAKLALIVSLVGVLAFMVVYYGVAGWIAVFALLSNLLLTLGLIVLMKAALTLPGMAGLVLTVGMSVDANVLIYERIREELARKASLRMAIRNGFSRAMSTIIDSNVTTLITSIVLYMIGTDQIRGFAVTLIIGILMSMFTAIFCSRVILDIAERTRLISTLKMSQLLGQTSIDFLKQRWWAGGISLVLIALGIVGVVARGADIFDIDFRGGTSVNFVLQEPMQTQEVRDRLRPAFADLKAQYTLTAMNSGGREVNKSFKVDSSLLEVEQLQDTLEKALVKDDGSSLLATYNLQFGDLKEVVVLNTESPKPTSTSGSAPAADGSTAPASPAAETPQTTPPQPAPSADTPAPAAAPATPASAAPAPPAPQPTPPQSAPETPAAPAPAPAAPAPAPAAPVPAPAAPAPAPAAPAPASAAPASAPAAPAPAPAAPAPAPAAPAPAPAAPAPASAAPAPASAAPAPAPAAPAPAPAAPASAPAAPASAPAAPASAPAAPAPASAAPAPASAAPAPASAAPAPASAAPAPEPAAPAPAPAAPATAPATPAPAPAAPAPESAAPAPAPAADESSPPPAASAPSGSASATQPESSLSALANVTATDWQVVQTTDRVGDRKSSMMQALSVVAGDLLALGPDATLLLAQVTEPAEAAPAPTAPATPAAVPSIEPASTPETPQAAADEAAKPASPAEPATSPEASAPTVNATEAGAPATEGTTTPPSSDSTPLPSSQIEVPLEFTHAINFDTLNDQLTTAIKDLNLPISFFEISNPAYLGGSNAFSTWNLRIAASKEQTQQLLQHLEKQFSTTPVWEASNKIGSQVAGRIQTQAIYALLASLIGIAVYIWIRFHRLAFGLAAVIALIHDVLVTVGAIALSTWLAGALGFLLIEEFKISLPIVAALLTIIGYSLNDTIVIFDRIREVRGKSPELTEVMINTSINQTLSRTLLTSLTTLIVVVILYAIGGEGIHGFAFALVVGVVAGTYSTVFIASPFLLWMVRYSQSRGGK